MGPKWLERTTHFFGAEPTACLEARLRAAAWVTSVRALPDAYVPVLKLDIKGVDIDMTFAQLPLAEVPAQLDLQRNELLAGMDEKSMLSINGCRVTDRLVQLVTDRCGGLRSFQGALRFLKARAARAPSCLGPHPSQRGQEGHGQGLRDPWRMAPAPSPASQLGIHTPPATKPALAPARSARRRAFGGA